MLTPATQFGYFRTFAGLKMVARVVFLVVVCSVVVVALSEKDSNQNDGRCVDGCLAGACITGRHAQPHASRHTPLPNSLQRHGLGSNFCRTKQTVECQDHTLCPTGYSCCHTPEYPVGSYSCCPYGYSPVCCADGSCCAQGFRCEPKWGICTPEIGTRPLTSSEPGRYANTTTAAKPRIAVRPGRGPRAMHSPSFVGDDRSTESTPRLECPDGSFCQQGSTCCPSLSRSSNSAGSGGPRYTCCPHEEAQCCNDGEHCCPSGTSCRKSRGGYRCLIDSARGRRSLPASRKYASFNDESYPSVPCPTWMICSTGQCCRDQYGAYRCSPYVDGVCCASGIVGCPAGMECAS